MGCQTDIVIGRNKVRSSALVLLGKRCWQQSSAGAEELGDVEAKVAMMKKVNALEKKRAIKYRRELRNVKEQLESKDSLLEETHAAWKEEVQAKRSAQKDLRLHREATQE